VILLFVTEWVRIDVVAIIMMVLLPELGLLKAGEAFRGLSSNAVIAIIGVMIISFGLNRTGLVNRIIQPLLRFVRKGASRLVVVFSSLIAVISSVMQNTGAAVLFLPAIELVANRELKTHVSRVLMPIGMAAILGGTLTMVGTSPLILLNDILPPGMDKFGFLELTPIGLCLAVTGIIYLSTVGMKLLSRRSEAVGHSERIANKVDEVGVRVNYPEIEGPFEIQVPEHYQPGDGPQQIAAIRREYMVNIVAMIKQSQTLDIAPRPRETIEGRAALCVYGRKSNVQKFVKDYGLMLMRRPTMFRKNLFDFSYAGLAEMIIAPRSQFIGRCIRDIRFRDTFDVNALALHQKGEIYYRELADRSLSPGDAVLIHGTWEQIQSLRSHHQNFIIVTSSKIGIHRPEKARPALLSFLLSLVLMLLSSFYFQRQAYNPIPLSICLMVGAIAMVVTKVMSISEAYRSIDTRTVFLLGGLIPLGLAVDHTGTAQWIARGIVLSTGGVMPPLVLLIVLAVLSCAFTMVVSNVGACALLVPLGISLASQSGIDPRVAAIVVGLGVSNSFILPTHQVNALYMGPGEYRTKDYIKIGGGLSLVYIAVLVAVTYVIYL
jgi:di/tricarboxylate transporter